MENKNTVLASVGALVAAGAFTLVGYGIGTTNDAVAEPRSDQKATQTGKPATQNDTTLEAPAPGTPNTTTPRDYYARGDNSKPESGSSNGEGDTGGSVDGSAPNRGVMPPDAGQTQPGGRGGKMDRGQRGHDGGSRDGGAAPSDRMHRNDVSKHLNRMGGGFGSSVTDAERDRVVRVIQDARPNARVSNIIKFSDGSYGAMVTLDNIRALGLVPSSGKTVDFKVFDNGTSNKAR